MITIAFINQKGGVGKTASVTTIAHMLTTLHNKKVLMIDLDPQGNTSALYSERSFTELFLSILKNTPLTNKQFSIEDILQNPNMDIHDAIIPTTYEGLDIIPSYLTLSVVEEALKADITSPQQFKLKTALTQIKDEYDYCLIDCSPSVSLLNINGLVASDEIYIPVRCDGASCIGLAISINLVKTVQNYNPTLKIGGCFLTQYSSRKNVSGISYDFLRNVLGDLVLPIKIGTTKLLEENTFQQLPLLELDKGKNKCSVTKSYMQLTEYIISPNQKMFLEKIQK